MKRTLSLAILSGLLLFGACAKEKKVTEPTPAPESQPDSQPESQPEGGTN